MKATLAGAAAALVALIAAPNVLAFCRATTCDPGDPAQGCRKDGAGCLTTGTPLFWESNCLKVGVNAGGSARHGISFEQLRDVTAAAFQSWIDASCTIGKPSLHVEIAGPISCDQSEYNSGAGNVNLVVFRDDVWPYAGAIDVLGRTTVRFDTDTGELWDADIEINGTQGPIGVDGSGGTDLLSVLTHEAGHVLGLDHSVFVGSTMRAGYTAEDTSLRTLASDDEQGVCALFPPSNEGSGSCEPRGGFSDQCGGYIEPVPTPPAPADGGGCGLARKPPFGAALGIGAAFGIACFAARRRRAHRNTES